MRQKPAKPETHGPTAFQWWSTSEHIGHGWRLVIAFDPKRKYLSLLGCGDLTLDRVTIQAWENAIRRGTVRKVDIDPKRLARQLDRLRRQRNRLGLSCANATVKRLAAAIKASPTRHRSVCCANRA